MILKKLLKLVLIIFLIKKKFFSKNAKILMILKLKKNFFQKMPKF